MWSFRNEPRAGDFPPHATEQLEVSHSALTFTGRFLVLYVFGQQFQRPLDKISYAFLTIFTWLFWTSIQHHAVHHRPGSVAVKHHALWKYYVEWVCCILAAACYIFMLHRFPIRWRFSALFAAWAGILWLLLSNTGLFLSQALPVCQFRLTDQCWSLLGMDIRLALWVCLIPPSGCYHAKRGQHDYNTYAAALLWLIEQARPQARRVQHPAPESPKEALPTKPIESPSQVRVWDSEIAYTVLPAGRIRLLEIGQADHTYHLSQQDLTQETQYYALSYHWGGATATARVTLDQADIHVPSTVYDALEDVRNLNKHFPVKWIWIDYLCINQRDDREKAAQLKMMPQIYANAGKVLAWLGPSEMDSVKIMRNLARDINASSPTAEDVGKLVERPYWRRAWIVPEIANALEVVVFWTGECIPLSQVQDIVDSALGDTQTFPDPRLRRNIKVVDGVLRLRKRKYAQPMLGLLETLMSTSGSKTSRPHDKVFAMLGLAGDYMNFLSDADINYKTPLDEISLKMTETVAREKRNLDIILAGGRSPHRQSSLPSFCPDYFHSDEHPLNPALVRYISGQEDRYRLGIKGLSWLTTSGTNNDASCSFTFSKGRRRLEVNAVKVGTIDNVSLQDGTQQPCKSRRDTPLEPGYSFYDGISRILLLYSRKYEKLARAPLAPGRVFTIWYDFATAWSQKDYKDVHDWARKNADFNVHGHTIENRCTFSFGQIALNCFKACWTRPLEELASCVDYHEMTLSIKALIDEGLTLVTLRQGLMGWAVKTARPGHEVWLVGGCSVPVVLQMKEEEGGQHVYTVVGHAYVDTCMDGSRWKKSAQKTRIVLV